MITAGIALAILFVLAAEAMFLWIGQLHRVRREVAYWEAKRNAPDLYDWARELDL